MSRGSGREGEEREDGSMWALSVGLGQMPLMDGGISNNGRSHAFHVLDVDREQVDGRT